MKALVKYEKGVGKFALKEIPVPEPSPDDVQIKIAYGGICGTDIHIYHDTYADDPPFVVGHEFSGVITKVGSNVKGFKVGDRVVSETNQSYCGVCDLCQDARYCLCNDRKALGQKTDGVFAEYAIVKSSNLFKLADHIDMKSAALAEPLSCVVHAIMERSTVQADDIVLVSGPGPIGLLATMVAVKQGARVIVSGTSADTERLVLAKEFGAYRTVDVQKEDLLAVINEETKNKGCDVVLECSGFGGAIQSGLQALKKRGIFTQIGLTGKPTAIDTDLLCYREIDYHGCLSKTNWSWRRTMKLMEGGELPLERVISHVFDLDDWQEAMTAAEQKKGNKIFFDIGKGSVK
jgi:L-iditol 2-dehydrogenase